MVPDHTPRAQRCYNRTNGTDSRTGRRRPALSHRKRSLFIASAADNSLDRYAGYADLVLAGGGVKGIGHVGALEVLEERGYRDYPRVAGTSVGAIVGALVAAGMRALEIEAELLRFDFHSLRDPSPLDRVPAVGKAASILWEHGIYEGEAVRDWLDTLLVQYEAETFAKLRERSIERHGGDLCRGGSPLVVFATDVTRGRLVRFPDDYAHYGRNPGKQRVADAVRASLSIPLFFEPVRIDDSLLVDGGVLSNYAVDAFDVADPANARWPTFGIVLIDENTTPVLGRDLVGSVFPPLRFVPRRVTGFLEDLIGTLVVGQDFHALGRPGVARRTIQVNANAYGVVDFDIGRSGKLELVEAGRRAAEEFLQTWDGDDGRAGAPTFALPKARTLAAV